MQPLSLLAATLLAVALLAHPTSAQASPGPVSIAVVDSGIDATHAEFQGRTVERHSFVQPSVPVPTPVPGLPNPFDTLRPDPDGQGTAVASRAAGATLGIAPEATLVDLQVSGKYTTPTLDPATEAAAAQAMDWLVANHGGHGSAGPRVVLLSFAGRDLSGPGAASLEAQARQLWSDGVLVVVPAGGNSSLNSSPYVITVGASEGPCGRAEFSPAQPLKPDLTAPAKDITVARAKATPQDSGTATNNDTGVQYAAAAVAGAAAQAWAARSDLPVAALAAILRDTAQDLGETGPDECGFGALDLDAVLAAAVAWRDPTPTEPLSKPTPGFAVLAAVGVLAWGAQRKR